MADDKTKTGQQDRRQVNGSEDYEVRDFIDSLKQDGIEVTKQEVLDAIKQAGTNDREALKDYLKKNRK